MKFGCNPRKVRGRPFVKTVSLFGNICLDPNTGCWNWTGGHDTKGYGVMRYKGRAYRVHQISAMLYMRHDPSSGLFVLHRCDNVRCFNPKHLYLGTQLQNVRDIISRGRHWSAVKTACRNGHPYTRETTYYRPGTTIRACRLCRNEAGRRRDQKVRESREIRMSS